MRNRRSTAATLFALGLVLSAAGTAVAKGDAVVTLDAPLPTDPTPGSIITVEWTLDMPDGTGSTVRLNSEGVFVRFTPTHGAPVEEMARQDREGHYIATITVPAGGLGHAVFGLKGETCFAGRPCERSDIVFPVASEARRAVPDPVVASVVPVATLAPAAPVVRAVPVPVAETPPTEAPTSPTATPDLTLLPLVALVGLAAAGLALLVRGRSRSTAT